MIRELGLNEQRGNVCLSVLIALTGCFRSTLITSIFFKLTSLPLAKSSVAAPPAPTAAPPPPDKESAWSPEAALIAPTAFEGTLVSDGTAFADGEGDDLTTAGLFEVDWGGDEVVFEDNGEGIEPEGGVFTVDARVQ